MPFAGYSGDDFDRLKAGFGFVPRYSGYKVARNVSNGGFSLRSSRDIFQPYMLDKFIGVGERVITKTDDNEWTMLRII